MESHTEWVSERIHRIMETREINMTIASTVVEPMSANTNASVR